MTNQYSTDALRSMLDILGGVSEYRGAVLDFLDYVDRTAAPQDEPGANPVSLNPLNKPVTYQSGVTYYVCEHYPYDAYRMYPCDKCPPENRRGEG
jgi:hypothetical protein